MTIQWYPGHMAKAKRELNEKIKLVDVIIELVDARIPMSSRNPLLIDLANHKPRIIVLNKMDMADPDINKLWLRFFKNQGWHALATNAKDGQNIKPFILAAKEAAKPVFEKMKAKGMKPRALRAMIVGVPNVGKSTFINRLIRKRVAKTGDQPGITKKQQWLKIGNEMELLDTPGLLWPKFEHEDIGFRLAATGAIKDELFDFEQVSLFVLHILKERYPTLLADRYQLENLKTIDGYELLAEIGKKRGTIEGCGNVNIEQAAELVLRELRSGKLGQVSLETPEDVR